MKAVSIIENQYLYGLKKFTRSSLLMNPLATELSPESQLDFMDMMDMKKKAII